jgi:hypothetical protein
LRFQTEGVADIQTAIVAAYSCAFDLRGQAPVTLDAALSAHAAVIGSNGGGTLQNGVVHLTTLMLDPALTTASPCEMGGIAFHDLLLTEPFTTVGVAVATQDLGADHPPP